MNGAASADESGISLPARPDHVLDVHFGDRRIFSLSPKGFRRSDTGVHAGWPASLERFLHGHTRLVVREHLSGDVLLDQPLRFGDSTEPVTVEDRQGRPLAVDKFGALARMFSETDRSNAQSLARQIEQLTDDVNAFGVAGFVAFGSLLGAVRNGRLIGHDIDADMAYLSNHSHPADVALESFALERFLSDRGWTIERLRVGLCRALFDDEHGDPQHIDIFVGVHDGNRLMIDRFVWAEVPRDALVPLSTVTLEGVEIAAPGRPDVLLEATYGPTYQVPDPTFSYTHTRAHDRTALAWLGNYRLARNRWQRRLGSPSADEVNRSPSELAVRVADGTASTVTVLDVGCGTGEDALWLAERGHHVVGLDYVDASLRRSQAIAERRKLPAEFHRVSLYDMRLTVATGIRLLGQADERVVMSRHLIDVLEIEGRRNFWMLSRTLLLSGGRLYLRFRTAGPSGPRADPRFRPLDPDMIAAEAHARGADVVARDDRPTATEMVLSWA
ncbi:MAG TPA: class I SAM-dependent methyltransferase [Nocardioidaceae bacterium]|nr:class I SAM-dependent methyltransferase [Nocardioidaceae bacterium]